MGTRRGIRWTEVPQCGVVRRLARRDGWAARRDAFMAADPSSRRAFTKCPAWSRAKSSTARSLGLADDPCPHMQAGGRARGLVCLDSFLTHRGPLSQRHVLSIDGRAPARGSHRTSRLALSVREVVQATARRQSERHACPLGTQPEQFFSRGSHGATTSEAGGRSRNREPRPARGGRQPARQRCRAAASLGPGRDGHSFLDACMRYLRATGWLVQDAGDGHGLRLLSPRLDWRQSGAVLASFYRRARHPLASGADYSRASPRSTGRASTIRCKQGLDQDPTGAFIRRWLHPNGRGARDPSARPLALVRRRPAVGEAHPEPIVDVAAAAPCRARGDLWPAPHPGFAEERAEVLERHGSRMPPRSRTGTRGKSSSAQLSLDL